MPWNDPSESLTMLGVGWQGVRPWRSKQMDDPIVPRKIDVNEFVAESLDEIASHSSDPQSIRNMAMGQRTVPRIKDVNVYDIPKPEQSSDGGSKE
jgi:hypothetical protein